ncbi:MAG: TerB family tellurite resistance protein [Bacteroidetes bacterium]|jgi:DnaJ like chaperone protein|nr:TerB family tellurite resistance protein [Bacteroidota bacterium]
MGIEKWIGAGLGWAFGGPIGALIGFSVGSWLGNDKQPKRLQGGGSYDTRGRRTTVFDFKASLLVLTAAVMKADGKILKSELDYVKRFFIQNFGTEETKRDMLMLRDLLKKEIPLDDVLNQVRRAMTIANRRQLFYYLVGIATADGHVDEKERQVLYQISNYFGLSIQEFNSAFASYKPASDVSPYTLLEIESSATNEEVKKAYRKLARKYHPDLVANLGPAQVKSAEDHFKKMKNAYEDIKKMRGMR